MWRELEEDAIKIGLDLHYFWSLDVKQFEKHIKVFNEEEERKFRDKDALNFLLGQYIAFAFNNPKKYPSKPFLEKKEEKIKEMSFSQMERQAKINTVLMGGVIK